MGSKPKIVVPQPPPPPPEETRSKKLAVAGQELSISELGYDIQEDTTGNIKLVKRPLTPEQVEEEEFNKRLQKSVRERLFGEISPETRQLVGTEFASAQSRGEEDINRFAREMAGARNLNLSDTPIGGEAVRAQERLTTGLRGAEASALLNAGERQQLFAQSLREFREGLRQQAFVNRLNLSGQAGQFGIGLGQNRAALFRPMELGGGGSGIGSILGGAGQGLEGLALFGQFAKGFSSRQFKNDISPLESKDYDRILADLETTPIYRWRYKPEFEDNREHIGPVTEEAPEIIVSDDGKALVPIDYLGFIFAAIKALNGKVKQLEQKNG